MTWAETPSLRVVAERESRIFTPAEEFLFDLEVDPSAIGAGVAFELNVALLPSKGSDPIWRGETQRIEAPNEGPAQANLMIPLPKEEGVYRVLLRASRPSGFANRFIRGGAKTLAEREFQVLVFDPQREVGAPASWREEYSFNPASPRWRDRLQDWADWRRLPWIDRTVLSSLPDGARRVESGPYMSLPPASSTGAHWQAYILPNDRPGEARVVEIEWPTDESQQLVVSLFDRTEDGALQPLCEPAVVEAPKWGATGEKRTARLVCWPQTREPLLVVANPHTTTQARYGRIRLLAPEGRIERTESARLVTLDWGRSDPLSSVGLNNNDLHSRYLAAKRIADRVQLAGANGGVIDVSTNDIARIVYDEGTEPDLPQAGLLDLLLREFNRRNLQLVPALRFNTPLPGIESIRARADSGGGWQWVDSNGKTLSTPEYSPLHPRVAEEMIAVATSVAENCASHASFAGLAVRLGEDSYSLLAGDESGFDSETVDRFLASQGLQWPQGEQRGPAAHFAAIRENVDAEWRRWRYQQLTSLYSQVAEQAMAANPNGIGLLMTPEGLLSRAPVRRATTPRLGAEMSRNNLLLRLGLLPPEKAERLLPLAMPISQSLHGSLIQGASSRSASEALRTEWARVAGDQSSRVVAIVAAPLRCQLIESAKSLKTSDQEDLILLANPAPTAGASATITKTFAQYDFANLCEGGAAAGGLLDDSAAAMRKLIAELPDSPVETSAAPLSSEVVTRVLRTETACVVLVVNPSPWPSAVSLTVETHERSLFTPLEPKAVGEWCEVGSHALSAELAPYSIQAWNFSTPVVQVLGIRTQPRPAAKEELRLALEEVKSRDRTAQRPFELTPNPSFESRDKEGLPLGWTYDRASSSLAEAAPPTGAADGNHALRITSDQSVLSHPFAQPKTGQYVLLFQAQGNGLQEGAALRLDIDTTNGGYHVHTIVQAEQLNSEDWRPVIFGVDDLPLDPAAELTVRFSLKGEGEIWIDALQAESLLLPLEAYSEQLRGEKLALVKLIHAAESALEENQLVKCQELLDSYWMRFLTEYFPMLPLEDLAVTSEAPVDETQQADSVETEEAEEESPSMADRVKGWLWK